jgi:sec-independent protein translocase protein TatB
MFNLSGSEIVFLLLIALIVLGPEKLPEAVRKFGKMYAEFKKMSTGFQSELRTALDEPMREMRETADAIKKAADFNFDDEVTASEDVAVEPEEAPTASDERPQEPAAE